MKKRYENSIKSKLQHMIEEDKELMRELVTFPPGSFGAEEIKLVMDLNSMISNMLISLLPNKLEEIDDRELYNAVKGE